MNAFAVLFAISPLADVLLAVAKYISAKPVFFIFLEFALVRSPVFPSQDTLAMHFIILPKA
jgi:hypothetical protein